METSAQLDDSRVPDPVRSESSPCPDELEAEWDRVELLAECLLNSRQGREIEPAALDQLRALQDGILAARRPGGPWSRLTETPLSTLELDALAFAIAPEARPRLGWLLQTLQPGLPPYPTLALLQDLLALEGGAEVSALYGCLAEDAPLRRELLVRIESGDPMKPIRPGYGVAARLMAWPESGEAPPGTTRVRLRAGWEDLVLPPAQVTMLREFMLWITHRDQVVRDWGGDDFGGPVGLFSGPSGTGKTLAAAVVANELGWPLYRVDLGKLVSKYIGETEKNLNSLFDAAHARSMVLQFDEADSLFSKRGEVKEARDRYANMEVSHLLARIEAHRGPCILTTNLRSHLDSAFARRFQAVIEFPRPDWEARMRLWARLLPPGAPRGPGVDPAFLGHAVGLTGGEIRNAALHAAFLAAGEGCSIDLRLVATAVYRELCKQNHEITRGDLGPLAEYLPEAIA